MPEAAMTSNDYLFPPLMPTPDPTHLPEFASCMASPSVGRYWRTLKHLRASQICYLARHRLFGRNSLDRWSKSDPLLSVRDIVPPLTEWQPALARRILQLDGIRFVEPGDQSSALTPWWTQETLRRQFFHANYCDFLNVDLRAPEDTELLAKATRIALSWRDQNPTGREKAWQQFSLSIRIVNWLKYLVRNARRAEEIGDRTEILQMLSSLRIQVLSLESRLEKELLANHLLKNAKALVFAGALLDTPESDRWRNVGQKILREQIAEQILPDGGHVERSPMYHAWILDDMLDIKYLFSSYPPEVPACASAVSGCVEQMSRYLMQIVHPDGEIPLLNDAQLDVTRPTQQILLEGGAPAASRHESGAGVQTLQDTGYAIIRDQKSRSFLIFDCGPLGPDYQPGHGHSDVLTYELSLNGQRVIVDTGVSSYEPGVERHYERSTAAHNTIRVDGLEQAEIWGSFRVGHRPAVSRIHYGEVEGGEGVRGAHFGYMRVGVVHSRTIIRLSDNSWFFVDSLRGKGSHTVESFIHLHPGVRVSPHSEVQSNSAQMMVPRYILQFGAMRYVLMTSGGGVITEARAWYSPGFAIRLPQTVIQWTREGELPMTMVYAVVPEGASQITIGQLADQRAIELNNVFVPLE